MRALVGTSGYNYDAWKGHFYPEKLAKTKMLSYYAGQLPTVEINYTFYRLPNAKTLESWAGQTPDGFRFSLKASQKITHQKRLDGVGELVDYFCKTAETLGSRLGPTLYQLPPNLKKDAPRLQAFLETLPRAQKAALEFRHASWFDDTIYQLLKDAGVALCIADTDDLETPLVRTAEHGYFRLRREDYDERALAGWAERLSGLAFPSEVFVYFKHEDEGLGPAFAKKFVGLLATT
jgi:uncharacterized protein YecE (DUF72 family)